MFRHRRVFVVAAHTHVRGDAFAFEEDFDRPCGQPRVDLGAGEAMGNAVIMGGDLDVKIDAKAELARRRYMKVNLPDNRLVADALEAEWNDKLRLHMTPPQTTSAAVESKQPCSMPTCAPHSQSRGAVTANLARSARRCP